LGPRENVGPTFVEVTVFDGGGRVRT